MSPDFWPAVAIAAAGLFFLGHLWAEPARGAVFGVGPTTLPTALAALLALLGAVLAGTSLCRRPAAAVREVGGPAVRTVPRVAGLLLVGLAYAAALPWLGYYLASALFVPVVAWMLGSRSPLALLALALVAPLALLLFFEWFMVVPLPSSRLLR